MSYLIAGGGTGGHVFMGIAVADALKVIKPEAQIIFVGTARGLELSAVPRAGYKLELIEISGIKGKSRISQLKALLRLPFAIWQSFKIVRKYKPTAVLGVGGYASAPALVAAFILRIPIALCEPNSVPGLVNKILSRFSRVVFTTFLRAGAYFPKQKTRLMGNPIRGTMALSEVRELNPSETLHILVLGGSQGAKALNDLLPQCFFELKRQGIDLVVTHQTGKEGVHATEESYKRLQIEATVTPFIDNMTQAYRSAHLVICRAGAATCAEVMSVGPVGIFVPLPNSIYDHQTLNAKELEQEGAAFLMPQSQISPAGIAKIVHDLINNPENYKKMNARARQLAKPDAAFKIAQSFINHFNWK